MPIKRFAAQAFNISFKHRFAHASAVRAETESVLVRAYAENGMVGIGEGCPRCYVTGEDVDSIQRFVEAHKEQWTRFDSVHDVRDWFSEHAAVIDVNPAAWCAVETAILDLLGKEAGKPVEALLGLPPLAGSFQYTAVLGAEDLASFEKQFNQYLAVGFTDFKVKVSGRLQEDIAKLQKMREGAPIIRVRLDANNYWETAKDALKYLRRLPGTITAIEEPLKVGDYDGCLTVAKNLGVPVILDESFLRKEQFANLGDCPSVWVINIRISKMGGILRSWTVAHEARNAGVPIVIGAQVGETSILTRAALAVANGFRDILLAQEGAFGTHLLDHDVCDPILMFGKGGKLSEPFLYARPGLGLVLL